MEKIYSLGNNTWLVYSIGTIATNQVCPKTNTLLPITIKSGHPVTVQAGCNIPTMDHLFSEDDSEDTEILNSWLDWTMSLPELFNHEDTAQLTAMIKDIRKHINGDFDASQLLKQLDNVQKPFSADHWRFSSTAAMLVLALLLAVVSIVVWKKCCAQAPNTVSPPPAPQIQQPVVAPAPPPAQLQDLAAQVVHRQPLPAYSTQNPTFNFKQPPFSSTLK